MESTRTCTAYVHNAYALYKLDLYYVHYTVLIDFSSTFKSRRFALN